MAVSTTPSATTRPRKFGERRAELVACALSALDELGYARTSLREIAQHSDFSHGVLHYYFTDKAELMADCMEQYRDFSATHFAELLAAPGETAADYGDGVAAALARSLVADAPMHRLWADLRTQSMFEPALQQFVTDTGKRRVQAVDAIVARYAGLAGTRPAVTGRLAEAAFDGMIDQHVVWLRFGHRQAARELAAATRRLLALLAGA